MEEFIQIVLRTDRGAVLRSLFGKVIVVVLCSFVSCSPPNVSKPSGMKGAVNGYVDMTTTKRDIADYGLVEMPPVKFGDVELSFMLPAEMRILGPSEFDNNLVRYEMLGESPYLEASKYVFSIDFLESRNTRSLTDKEVCEIMEQGVGGDLAQIEALFPKSIFRDLTVVSADFNHTIHGKHFIRRNSTYVDNRLVGTEFENVPITEFHYAIYFGGKKFEYYLTYFGSDKSVGSLTAYFNAIAGTFKLTKS